MCTSRYGFLQNAASQTCNRRRRFESRTGIKVSIHPLHLPHICRALYQSAISCGHSSCWPRTTSFRTLCKPAVYSGKWCRWCCPRCPSRWSLRSGSNGSAAAQKYCRPLSRPATLAPVSSGQTCWTWRCRAAGEYDDVMWLYPCLIGYSPTAPTDPPSIAVTSNCRGHWTVAPSPSVHQVGRSWCKILSVPI